MIPQLNFRVDASKTIGTGHFMRCLTLSQWAKKDGLNSRFFFKELPHSFLHHAEELGFEMHQLNQSSTELDQIQFISNHLNSGSWIVLDGYSYTSELEKGLKSNGLSLLTIDDMSHRDEYFCDILLNQNTFAEESLYMNKVPSSCKLLLGAQYSLLREEFVKSKKLLKNKAVNPLAQNLLLTLGGTDHDNYCAQILEFLEDDLFETINIRLITSEANPNLNSLNHFKENSRHQIEILLDSKKVSEHMAWADCAISAGGTTHLELLCMGVPFICVEIAKNQNQVVTDLQEKELAWGLGKIENITKKEFNQALRSLITRPELREKYRSSALQSVDGLGAKRVLNYLKGDHPNEN